jgi:hypothetical protein
MVAGCRLAADVANTSKGTFPRDLGYRCPFMRNAHEHTLTGLAVWTGRTMAYTKPVC